MAPRIIPPGPWNVFPDQWDRVVLNDVEWPGLATVEVTRSNKWDSKKAKGQHGEEREYSGSDPAKVTITIKFWDFNAWYELVVSDLIKVVEPDPSKTKVDSIKIQHAIAQARGVDRITVDTVSGPTKAEDGIWTLKIDATQYLPPSTKNATGTATGKGAGGDPRNAPNRCADLAQELAYKKAELADIYSQINEIEGGGGDIFGEDFSPGEHLSQLYGAAAENRARQDEIVAQQQELRCDSASASSSASEP